MPRYNLPEELVAAAQEHVRARHEGELPLTEIGRPTARKDSIRLTWDTDEELGVYFLCRRCQEGFGRYFLEVERQQPTERLFERAARHFAERHPEQPLSPERLWHEGNRTEGALATFMPMVPQLGASIICALCPQGMNHVFLTAPPYGDARRLHYLLSERPELYEQTRGYSSKERAEYVEAIDRGDLQRHNRRAGGRALAQAAAEREQRDAREQALVALLRERAPKGKGITRVIEELDRLSLDDPVEFSCVLASVIPGFAELAGNVAREQLASALARHLGCAPRTYPVTSESELWKLWAAVRAPGSAIRP